ncbi:hypothetical protein [Helicobacter acinonychis]|uniref:hypothetical protein n=1 Tax=Helicobacter acinonychis TaxID=212 RepID=UPI001F169F13|nr:hypothetical protein [Helicobacter acinonychis]
MQAQATGDKNNPSFAKDIYTFAQNQKTILSNAQSIFNLFNSIPKNEFEYLQKAYLKQPFLGTTPNPNDTPFKGNVNLNAEINAIQKNVINFSTHTTSSTQKTLSCPLKSLTPLK